jgi:hypothetical protein
MKLSCTNVYRHQKNKRQFDHCRSGVSLHSHTMHSKEYLGRLPEYIHKFPVGGFILEREIGRVHLHEHRTFDFRKIYWTPPLSPREADELERGQIEKIGLAPLVSLTDHDNIEAGKQLRLLTERSEYPISVEWTIPYEGTEFHIGIHNLPVAQADQWMSEFAYCTKNSDTARARDLFASLNENKSILLIFNHPYWDAKGVGPALHRETLSRFLKDFLPYFHALEVNGMRSRRENREVLQLGKATDMPVISGGDRHGLEPNVVLNVTRAASFEEFIYEVREDRLSEMLLMPQYFEPLPLRLIENACHALGDAPGEFGRRDWMTRIFIEQDGEARAVSQFAHTRFRTVVEKFRWVMSLVSNPVVRPALRLPFLGYEEGGL